MMIIIIIIINIIIIIIIITIIIIVIIIVIVIIKRKQTTTNAHRMHLYPDVHYHVWYEIILLRLDSCGYIDTSNECNYKYSTMLSDDTNLIIIANWSMIVSGNGLVPNRRHVIA